MRTEKSTLKKILLLGMLYCIFLGTAGCSLERKEVQKLEDLEFTVVEQSDIPEELKKVLEEKKEEGFKLTYTDKKDLYIATGYGKQETGGYSISADECYLTKNAIYLKTTLIGPKKGEKVNEVPSYPYIVVKTKDLDKNVVFE